MAKESKGAKPKKREKKVAPVPVRPTAQAGELVREPFVSLRREIDRLFDDFFADFRMPFFGRSLFPAERFRRFEGTPLVAAPSVDLSETDKAYEISAELPGMDEKDIEVELADDVLTIRGEKKEEEEKKGKDYYHSERRYGSFTRSFRLPDDVDQDKLGAEFKKGVLTVTLPKVAKAAKKTKKIGIKAK